MKFIAALSVVIVLCVWGESKSLEAAAESPANENFPTQAVSHQRELRKTLITGVAFRVESFVQLVEYPNADKNNPVPRQLYRKATDYIISESSLISEGLEIREKGDSPLPQALDIEDVFGVNGTYNFRLERQTARQNWRVKNFVPGSYRDYLVDNSSEMANLGFDEAIFQGKLQILDVEAIPVEKFFTLPEIDVQSVKELSDGRVAVRFTGNVLTPTGTDHVQDGTVWLDPNRYWAVDEYVVGIESVFEAGKVSISTCHHKVDWMEMDGLPVPRSISTVYACDLEKTTDENWLQDVEHEHTFTNWQRKTYPPERFQLTHYGLPERGLSLTAANQSSTARRNLLLWVNAVAILLLAIAAFFWWRSHRAT